MREVAWVYRPVVVTSAGRGRVRVENRMAFTSTASLRAEWELLVDGQRVRGGKWRLAGVDPLATRAVELPCALPEGDDEAQLTVRWFGQVCGVEQLVAWDQVELRKRRTARASVGSAADITPQLTLWRAATDNDGFKLLPDLRERIGVGGRALTQWLAAGVDHRPADELVQHTHRQKGALHDHVVLVPDHLDDLPRIGVTFTLPARFTQVRWFGRGPHENYPDRNASALLGVWELSPDEMPYLVPQEFGLRTDCRWFELIDPKRGEVIRVESAGAPLHCSATHFTAADLYGASTATELMPRRELVVHIDAMHRGVGTASCGPDVLPEYRIGAGRFRFGYWLTRRTLSGRSSAFRQ